MKSVELFDIEIFAQSKKRFLEYAKFWLNYDHNIQIATVNGEFMMRAIEDENFKKILKESINTPDGISIRAAGYFLNLNCPNIPIFKQFWRFLQGIWTGILIIFNQKHLNKIPESITGVDLFWDLLEIISKEKKSVYFVGASKEVLTELISRVNDKFPQLKICGYSYKKWDDPALPHEIAVSRPDLLLVAFGSPKQEIFLAKNKKLIGYRVGIGLGGTFDFITGKQKRAPKFVQKIGLEWLWRMILEPKRSGRIKKAFPGFAWQVYKKSIL